MNTDLTSSFTSCYGKDLLKYSLKFVFLEDFTAELFVNFQKFWICKIFFRSDLSRGQRLSRRSRGRGCHPEAPRRCWPGFRRRGSRGWRQARAAARSLRTDSGRTWPTPGSGVAGSVCWVRPSPNETIIDQMMRNINEACQLFSTQSHGGFDDDWNLSRSLIISKRGHILQLACGEIISSEKNK